MPDDPRFDDFLHREMNRHTADVAPPADAIWSAIESDVAAAIQPPRRNHSRLWITIGMGIAATLVAGVALGRWSKTTTPTVAAVATTPAPAHDDSIRAT